MRKQIRYFNWIMLLSLNIVFVLTATRTAAQPSPDLKKRIERQLAADPLLASANIRLKLSSETFGDIVLYMVSGNRRVREHIFKGADVFDSNFSASFGTNKEAEETAKTLSCAVAGIYALEGVKKVQVKAMVNTLYDKGSDAYNRKDYSKALEYYTKASEQGDALVLYRLGFMYRNGLGTSQDNLKAGLFFGKAAKLGYAAAQCNLGYLYNNGLGVEKDHAKAFELYSQAASQNYSIAQNNLGRMYEKALGVTRDYAKAVEWYTKSFKQGYSLAGCNLGEMYGKGLGIKRDYAKAVDCFNMAISKKARCGTLNLAWLYATAGDPSYRNGKRAVELAESLVPQNEDTTVKTTPSALRVLAAAYARDGQFSKAIETQEKCIALLNTENGQADDESEENLEDEKERIKLYKAETAYTDDEE